MIGAHLAYSGGFATTAAEAEFPIFWSQLAAYWSPIAQAGGSKIITLGRIRHTGNLTNMAGRNFVPSEIGTAIRFDGTNDYIPINGNFQPLTPSVSGPFTYSAWVRPANTTATMGIIKLGDELTVNGAIGLYLNILGSGQFSLECAGNKGVRTGSGAMVANRWQHVCVTRGNIWNLYIDGVNQTIATQTAAPSISWVGTEWIGRFGTAGEYFNGQIGEIGLWTRWMPARMVRYLAAGASPLLPNRRGKRYFFSFPQSASSGTGHAATTRFPKVPTPARNASQSRYPHLWHQLYSIWSPNYQQPGGTLFDHGQRKMHLHLHNDPLYTASTTTQPKFVSTELGRALKFDGIDDIALSDLGRPYQHDIVSVPSLYTPLTQGSGPYTISAWIKPSSVFQPAGILKWGGPASGAGGDISSLYINYNDLNASSTAYLYGSSYGHVSFCGLHEHGGSVEESITTGPGVFSSNEWVHIVIVKVPGFFLLTTTCRIYINGREVGTTVIATLAGTPSAALQSTTDTRAFGNPTTDAEPFMMGAYSTVGRRLGPGATGASQFYDGLIGEVAIWYRELSNNEIMQVFNGASPLEMKSSNMLFGVSSPEPEPEPEPEPVDDCASGFAGRLVRLRRA